VAARFDKPLVFPSHWRRDEGATETFRQRVPPSTKPRWEGKTVLLVDERTVSQAEHTGLFFRAANGTRFVGSPTNGANGDVTNFRLPGGLVVTFTGQSVRHPDGRALQRVGLQPDILVKPTRAGIRAGRDEVLERAVALLVPDMPKP
jgi:C-terminal processing protease CtpA/Prc